MKADPVVALLTAGGKTLKLPHLIVGVLEEMAADPRHRYGRTRPEILRGGLVALQQVMDRHEARQSLAEQFAAILAEEEEAAEPVEPTQEAAA